MSPGKMSVIAFWEQLVCPVWGMQLKHHVSMQLKFAFEVTFIQEKHLLATGVISEPK